LVGKGFGLEVRNALPSKQVHAISDSDPVIFAGVVLSNAAMEVKQISRPEAD